MFNISPFQGFFLSVFRYDGLRPSLVYFALSGLYLICVSLRWTSPIVGVFRPFRAFSVLVYCYDGLRPSLMYFALSGLINYFVAIHMLAPSC